MRLVWGGRGPLTSMWPWTRLRDVVGLKQSSLIQFIRVNSLLLLVIFANSKLCILYLESTLTFNLSLFSCHRAQISRITYNTSSTVTKEKTNGLSLKLINKERSLIGWIELGATKILLPKNVKWEHLQCTTSCVVFSPTFNTNFTLLNSTVLRRNKI